MKDYLNFDGLTHFFNKLFEKFISKDDVITDAEIDEICNTESTVEDSNV